MDEVPLYLVRREPPLCLWYCLGPYWDLSRDMRKREKCLRRHNRGDSHVCHCRHCNPFTLQKHTAPSHLPPANAPSSTAGSTDSGQPRAVGARKRAS